MKTKLIVLILFIAILSLNSVARDFNYTYDNQTLTYTVIDEEAKLCKVSNGKNVSGNLVIPKEVNDGNNIFSVVSIDDLAFYGSDLTSVAIPNVITSIGANAFRMCEKLVSVEIPESVNKIEESTFLGCSKISSIKLPNSLLSIGKDAFLGCSSLISITIPSYVTSIGYNAFKGCDSLLSIYFNAESCSECGSSENPVFPNTIQEVYIGNLVKIIPDYIFFQCHNLKKLDIGKSVAIIGDYAFYECRSLISLKIPHSVTKIGVCAFYFCECLTSIDIPESVTAIGSWAFANCTGVLTLNIPNSISTIEDNTFAGLWSLNSVTLPCSITSIGEYAFYGCGIESLTIPPSVTSIAPVAFGGCNKMTSLTLPKDITYIGDGAFESCNNLSSIYYESTDPISCNSNVFKCRNANSGKEWTLYGQATLFVPNEAIGKYLKTDPWKEFTKIKPFDFAIIESTSENTESINVIYSLNGVKMANSIDNLSPGIYIVRQGKLFKKIIIK
ncbi:MAG: leucine-rich repeat domain-containing protein [Muribaculaceae bacterium]|nr:leucine-rich repeat domain-containing protein [Muribaculaceae bacterium]